MATMYIYFFDFEVRVASRVRHGPFSSFWLIKVKTTAAEELTYNYSGVIKMSVNTNILAEKFVFSLRYCRLAVCIQRRLLNQLCICIYRSSN